ALEQVCELVGDALGPAAPEGLIGERDRQLLAVSVGHHPRELPRLRVLLGGLLGAGIAQEGLGQLGGALCDREIDVDGHDHRLLRPVYAPPRHRCRLGARWERGAGGGATARRWCDEARRDYPSATSSQPRGVTTPRSDARSSAVVVAVSSTAGPAIACPGASASRS